MFDQIFLSPQAKRGVIISDGNVLYKLPLELPNDLTSKKIRKEKENLKTSYICCPALSTPPKDET